MIPAGSPTNMGWVLDSLCSWESWMGKDSLWLEQEIALKGREMPKAECQAQTLDVACTGVGERGQDGKRRVLFLICHKTVQLQQRACALQGMLEQRCDMGG